MPEFFADLPQDLILAALMRMPGNEVKSGKIDSPESGAALVANAFGWFMPRPKTLPALAGGLGQARSVTLAAEMRYPWVGGKQPWLDVAVDTDRYLIGIAANRYEPFRPAKANAFESILDRPVWGDKMEGFTRLRRTHAGGARRFEVLDVVQLVKQAYGLRTQSLGLGKKPLLLYLYATPATWANGRPVDTGAIAKLRADIDLFAKSVAGDEVAFAALSWAELLALWAGNPACADHATRLADRFGPL